MENGLTVFSNEEFGEVRVIEIDDKQYFVASDVARALGYSNPRDAIKRHCKGVVKHDGVSATENQYGTITKQVVEMSFIPEGDVYRLIVKSKLPAAEKFESWVFDEVLPTIRQTGGYINSADQFVNTYFSDVGEAQKELVKGLMCNIEAQQKVIIQQNAKIEADAPKVELAIAIDCAENSTNIGNLAKILAQNGIDIGQNRLYQYLRDEGYLIKRRGLTRNMPMQKYVDQGLFDIKTSYRYTPSHEPIAQYTTMVTGKGVAYFVNHFLELRKAILA